MNYYNEFDPKAAAWLRELIAQGLIPAGEVDERSITDVRPHEISGFTQLHFFAGVGGWPLALSIAGWPHDRKVITGSCPCQPFSTAGLMRGAEDPRHLWPVFRDLITFREPSVTFGEQVASPAGIEWMSGVRSDLEGRGYEVGASDLCSASVGSPNIRQRIYWVANPYGEHVRRKPRGLREKEKAQVREGLQRLPYRLEPCRGLAFRGLGHPDSDRLEPGSESSETDRHWSAPFPNGRPWDIAELLPCRDGKLRRVEPGSFPLAHGVPARMVRLRGYGNAINPYVAAEFISAFLEAREMIAQ